MAKGLEYTQQELEGMKMAQLIPLTTGDVSRVFMEFFLRKKPGGAPTKTKSGKLVYVGGKAGGFIFKGEPYLVAYDMYIQEAQKESKAPQ